MKAIRNGSGTKRTGRSKMTGWIIALCILAVLGIAGAIGGSYVAKEHREASSLPLDKVDFGSLKDGVYVGEYEGGMYRWRANKVEVTVASGKVMGIRLLESGFEYKDTDKLQALYQRVMDQQTLQVDAISGATLTSNGYLQAVENALLQAENK